MSQKAYIDECESRQELLLELTCQRSAEQLLDNLQHSIAEILLGIPYRIYRLEYTETMGHYEVIAGDSCMPEQQLQELQLINQLVCSIDSSFVENSGAEVSASEHSDSALLPAIVRGKAPLIVALPNIDQVPSANLRLLTNLISVYANQLSLLLVSTIDALTELSNRQAFDQSLARIASGSLQHRHHTRNHDQENCGWYLALYDIDFFKRINDGFGHIIGDEVLVQLAQLARHCFREYDLLFRYGGEEFVVLLRDVDQDKAGIVLERFRATVAQHNFPQVGQVTLSVGYTQVREGESPPAIIAQADQALYYGKDNGRNQVHSYEALVQAGQLKANNVVDDIELF